jgi:holo-[acyl-carrier protein] synthase
MPIVGHGIDLVEIQRIAAMLERHGERFLHRVYTQGERSYSAGSKRQIEHLAVRFAAKEAVLKAMGTGWRNGIAWTDVEVVVEPSGKPTLRLHNIAFDIADGLGIRTWSLSLTHTSTHAMASAIGEG